MPCCDGTQSELKKNVHGLSISCCDETQRKFIKNVKGLSMPCCDETQSEFIKILRDYQCHVVSRLKVNLQKC